MVNSLCVVADASDQVVFFSAKIRMALQERTGLVLEAARAEAGA